MDVPDKELAGVQGEDVESEELITMTKG